MQNLFFVYKGSHIYGIDVYGNMYKTHVCDLLIIHYTRMERLDVSGIGSWCAVYLFCLKIGKIDVIGGNVDIGIRSFSESCVAAAVIFHHT